MAKRALDRLKKEKIISVFDMEDVSFNVDVYLIEKLQLIEKGKNNDKS